MVRNCGLGHADAFAYLLLREREVVQQSPQRRCLLDWIQIVPLQIFCQRDHQSFAVRALRDDAGNLTQIQESGRCETALTRNNDENLGPHLPHHNGFDDSQ